jgi:hypothetical protein
VDQATLETLIERGLTHSPLPAIIFDPAMVRLGMVRSAAVTLDSSATARPSVS